MSDTLEIFGTEYIGVNGIKATDDNDTELTYIRPQGSKSITANGTGIDVSAYATANVAVPSSSPNLQAKSNIDPTTSSQTIQADSGYDGLSSVQINAMPTAEYDGFPTLSYSGRTGNFTFSETITQAGYTSVDKYGSVNSSEVTGITRVGGDDVHVTPTESEQLVADFGTFYETQLYVDAIPSNYVGSGVTQRSSSDLTVSGAYVTAPAGYYASATSKSIGNVVRRAENPVTANPSISIGSNGLITATVNSSASITPVYTAGYISTATAIDVQVSGSATEQLTSRSSSDLTASGATVTAPAGYYASNASKSVASGTIGTPTVDITKTSLDYDIDVSFPITPGYINTSPSTTVSLDIEDKSVTPSTNQQVITPTDTNCYLNSVTVAAMPSGTEGTPTATKGTVSNHSVSVTPSVTNTAGYISGGTHNGTAVSVSASELVSGTLSVTSSGTKDVTNYASASIPAGTAGTPTATKGAVSNHAVTVTPSVTNQAGFIAGSTINGTGVSVSASELVSGNKAITENGTNIDVTDYATVSVNVSGGGGGGGMQVDQKTVTPLAASSSITITGLKGEPTSFILGCTEDLSTGASPFKVAALVYDGSDLHGQTITNTNNAQVTYDGSSFSQSYSNGTLTLTSTGAYFQAAEYFFEYTYGGTAANIGTASVQVGSGATSITFTGLEDEPEYFSCIFKSNFNSSNGYQRVIWAFQSATVGDMCGMEMDSAAHFANNWSYTYNNGSLTITSVGTNQGGYFHQPGYYQVTYGIGGDNTLQKKTVTPTTSRQVITADTAQGYEALSQVTVEPIPSQYIVPTGNKAITENGNNIDVAAYSTVSVNVPTGGGTVNIDTKSMTNSSNQNTSISFSSMKGQPKAFFARCTSSLSRSSSNTYYYVADMVYDGTSTVGNMHARSTGQYSNITSGYSWSYSGTTLTLSSSGARNTSPGSFYNGTYELIYIY